VAGRGRGAGGLVGPAFLAPPMKLRNFLQQGGQEVRGAAAVGLIIGRSCRIAARTK
jgi:hypothetical protein